MAALVSKTMLAVLQICVLLSTLARGCTENVTCPMPAGGVVSGGRKPASGSVTAFIVAGSSEVKDHVATPVDVSMPAFTTTVTFISGRRSSAAAKFFSPGEGVNRYLPKDIGPS